MKFTVYYRTDEEFVNAMFVRADSINPRHYKKIGAVDVTCLGDLFRCMNVVDGSDDEFVGSGYGPGGAVKFPVRSMCPGDVAIDENGQGHLCASVGWETFEPVGFEA